MRKPFAIHKNIIGSKQHLVVDADERRQHFQDSIPEPIQADGLVFGTKSFSELTRLYATPPELVPTFPSEAFYKAYRELFINVPYQTPPWEVCIPYKAYKQSVDGLVTKLGVVVDGWLSDLSYYRDSYKKGNEVFEGLKRVKVNEEEWKRLVETDSVLQSFKPVDDDGYCREVVYDRTETVSGRLKVKDGPNILHLKHEHRKVMCSRFGDDGALWYVDFSSLEPRVLLSLTTQLGLSTNGTLPKERDIYQYVLNQLFDNDNLITREVVKKIVLLEIYGAGIETLHRELSHVPDFDYVVSEIEGFFGVKEYKSLLLKEAEKNGYQHLITPYGRRVSIKDASPYMYINRVVQSTAVDVAMLGFRNIINCIKEFDVEEHVVPVLVLHDALILDVHNNWLNYIPTLCKVGGVDIPLFEDCRFYLKPTRLMSNE